MKNYSKVFFIAITLVCFWGVIASTGIQSFENGSKRIDENQKKIEKEFQTKFGGELTIDLKTGSEINIEGWDKEIVKATFIKGGRDADQISITMEKTNNGVEISSEFEDNDGGNSDCELIVMVPKKYNIDFSTMGGTVTIKNVEGELTGTTMGGEINLSQLKGKIEMTTMGGDINLTDSEVNGMVETMGGEVIVENVIGDVDAKSMGGKVQHKNVKGIKGKSVGKEVNITTMGGDLDIDEAPNGAYLKTMGGDITINSVSKFLEAETMGGDINVKTAEGKIKANTMGGDVEVKIISGPVDGDGDVKLSSMGGDIILYVPENFSMDIDIDIVYKKRDADRVKIISDFPIEETRKEKVKDSDDHHNGKHNHLYGKGIVGSGKNKIKITTINGTVTLKKL